MGAHLSVAGEHQFLHGFKKALKKLVGTLEQHQQALHPTYLPSLCSLRPVMGHLHAPFLARIHPEGQL